MVHIDLIWFNIQVNKVVCKKFSIKKKLATTEKLYWWLSLLINIKFCYKNRLQGHVPKKLAKIGSLFKPGARRPQARVGLVS